MDTQNTRLVLRDLPIIGWIFGVAFLVIAATNLLIGSMAAGTAVLVIRGVLALVGLVIILLSSVLTVTADRSMQTLTIRHRSLLKESSREILFSQIEAIEMEMSHNRNRSSSRSSGPTYRIVVVLKDGEVVPFRSYYSNGSMDKTNKIKRLREFIGVGGSEMGMGLFGTLCEASRMAQRELKAQQEDLTGSQDVIHETEGVRWQVQTMAFGGQAVTRWISPDYRLDNSFVYITQIVEGQKMTGGGLLAGLSNMLFKQAMSIYGFGQEDTPGIEQASTLVLNDPRLEPFSVYTSAPAAAQRVLNPWVTAALADWARRYPLKQFQSGALFPQLVVMYSPKGVYVACMGTMIPEAIEEMTRLGVELVKTQTSAVQSGPSSNQ